MLKFFKNKINTNNTKFSIRNKIGDNLELDKIEEHNNAIEPNLRRYKDQEGITIKKLMFGLWFLKNRKNFLYLFYTLLIVISVITWSLFFLTFGSYVITGMNEDKKLLNELSIDNFGILHNIVLSQSPQPFKYQKMDILKVDNKKYDFVIKVKNPNKKHGAEFVYYIMVNGKKYGNKKGFILPDETKYLLILGNEFVREPNNAEFFTDQISWTRINGHNFPNWEQFKNDRLKINTDNINFIPAKATTISEKIKLNTLSFSILNDTAYNFKSINFVIILLKGSKIVGVNEYALNSFLSGNTDIVDITWTGRISKPSDIIINPEINIMDRDIYIKYDGGVGEKK